MSKVTIRITLPIRAALWLQYAANHCGLSNRAWIETAVLRQLNSTPGIDLSRCPDQSEGGYNGEKEAG